jgi:hypothetical protein
MPTIPRQPANSPPAFGGAQNGPICIEGLQPGHIGKAVQNGGSGRVLSDLPRHSV